MKYTPTLQKKLEDVLKEAGYVVRYEKGTFNSGYCILENKRVVVMNKFHNLDSKINSLMEIMLTVEIDEEALSQEGRRVFHTVKTEKAADLFTS
jgi:hypothetical protein